MGLGAVAMVGDAMKAQKFNPKRDLPYLAAIAQAAQFALAGSVLLGPKGWLFGGLLGLLVSITMAYASSQYADSLAAKRKPYVMLGMILVGTFSPVIIGTSMYLDLPLSLPWWWRIVVGAVWGIIPDVSVLVAGFTAGKGMVAKEESETSETSDAKPSKAAKPAKDERILCAHNGAGCDRSFKISDYKSHTAAQNAANGHSSKCAYKPTVIDVTARR